MPQLVTGAADALKVVQPGADHGVTIRALDQRDLVLATLGAWLGMDIVLPPEKWGSEPHDDTRRVPPLRIAEPLPNRR